MFDMAEFDSVTRSEAGVAMPVLNPRNRRPLLNDDGSPISIILLGRQSQAFRETVKSMNARQALEVAERAASVVPPPPQDMQAVRDAENTELLIVCTRDWTFRRLDGHDFPCTPINIQKFWNDRRFAGIRDAALAFITQDVNFLDPLAFSSENSLATSSSSTAPSPTTAAPSATSSAPTA